MQKFSQEQLMLYVYGEASATLKLAIEKALLISKELLNEVTALKNAKLSLDDFAKDSSMMPEEKSIQKILDYSKQKSKKKK